jgi:hypothetical protein
MTDAELITLRHIKRVNELLGEFAIELITRGNIHDDSKFDPEELNPLQEMQDLVDREGQAPYGSDEYERRRQLLKPMLDHHYAYNSHHPEHTTKGINGMSLFDVVEMSLDWIAASERGGEAVVGLTSSQERFKIDNQLMDILKNTYDTLNVKYK